MENKNIFFILSLFLIFIVALGAVSAADALDDISLDYEDSDIILCDVSDYEDSDILMDGDSDIIIGDESNILMDDDSDYEADDLNDEINSDDSQIAENIKVNFSHTVYKDDIGNITVVLPEEAKGYLAVAIDEVIIYNETISEKSVQIPIVIPKPKFPYFVVNRNVDYTPHSVSIFYNDISLDFNHTLKVMRYAPDSGFFIAVPQEILKDDAKTYQSVSLVFPSSANGTVEVYLDGNLLDTFNATSYLFMNISKFNSLSLGNHTIKAIYHGDEYYLPYEANKTFEVVDFVIQIPSSIVLEHDDVVYAKSIKYTDGIVSVYFDGVKVISKKLDSYHEFLESLFDKVTCGEHLIEVQYNSSKFNYSKKQMVNVTFDVDIFGDNFRYGEDNALNVIVPVDFNPKLVHITIDDIVYPFKIDDSGWIDLNISKLAAGNHTLVFNFDGNKKYPAYNETYNFTVYYGFVTPYFIDYCDGSAVSIDLPPSANGNLEVYINDVLYRSVKLVNGKATIKVDKLACGEYKISSNYTGDDFAVENLSSFLYVYPKVVSPASVAYGENKFVEVQVSNDTKGYIIFAIGKNKYNVTIKDGKAKLPLKNLNIGEHDIDIYYVGEDGYNCTSYSFVFIDPAKIKITGAKNLAIPYTANKYYSVKVYNGTSQLAKGVTVTFVVGKSVYKVKTNKKGIASLSLSKFAPKNYRVIVAYKGTKVTKKLAVKHILKLRTAKVRKNAKKLVLVASLNRVNGKYLKNKLIKFTFQGKTYKAKTNSKGVAKVTIKSNVLKKLKVGKKIPYAAIYLKDLAKKTARVQK